MRKRRGRKRPRMDTPLATEITADLDDAEDRKENGDKEEEEKGEGGREDVEEKEEEEKEEEEEESVNGVDVILEDAVSATTTIATTTTTTSTATTTISTTTMPLTTTTTTSTVLSTSSPPPSPSLPLSPPLPPPLSSSLSSESQPLPSSPPPPQKLVESSSHQSPPPSPLHLPASPVQSSQSLPLPQQSPPQSPPSTAITTPQLQSPRSTTTPPPQSPQSTTTPPPQSSPLPPPTTPPPLQSPCSPQSPTPTTPPQSPPPPTTPPQSPPPPTTPPQSPPPTSTPSPQSPSPTTTTATTSTTTLPSGLTQEAVVAQLNQLQQTVVSHILQYQAGIIAQFQQIQQQMLSQLSSTTTTTTTTTTTAAITQPQSPSQAITGTTTSTTTTLASLQTPIPITTAAATPATATPPPPYSDRVMRKRKVSSIIAKEDPPQGREVHMKRKRTAFNEKQYKVLETTFEHNNFPEPIDQHCIALRIKTPYRSIKMWFQNRRASVRKRLTPQEKGAPNQDSRPIKNASDPDARWYCSLCPSTFIAKKFLDNHREAHKQETLYCPDCHLGFTHKVLLDTHRISKCSSKTGIDLTHLKDEAIDPPPPLQSLPHRRSLRIKEEIATPSPQQQQQQQPAATATATATPTTAVVQQGFSLQAGLPLLLLQKLQKQQEQQQETTAPVAASAGSSPPPLVQANPLLLQQQQQQQRLIQQLLLAQLQQAKEGQQSVVVKQEQQQEEDKEEQQHHKGMEEDGGLVEQRAIKEEIHIKEEAHEVEHDTHEEMDTGGGGGGGDEGRAEESPHSPSSSSSTSTTTITYSEQLKQTIQQQIQQIQQNQLHLKLQQIQQKQKELQQQQQGSSSATEDSPKNTHTLVALGSGGSHGQEPRIRVKEELQEGGSGGGGACKEPLTLQDQISSILKNHGLKSPWRTASPPVKGEPGQGEGDKGPQQERESMQEQIQAILRHQQEQRRKMEKAGDENVSEETAINSIKRCRRRTTVFNEVQLRTLYLHFTYCNFPDPSMFKIIGSLTKLEPQVIKIWFQNERSRQRKRAAHFLDEVNSKEKPYKCRDCGMSFAMLTFLVKHSMRHSGETDAAAAAREGAVRTCPLCLQKWNREVFASHLKSRHNVNWSLVEERAGGSLTCHLCSKQFPDQDSLMVHKHRHLDEDHGVPPQCRQCKTTFVNAVCLEAHMETHQQEWTFLCTLCDAPFPDKVLLASHHMGHGMPLAVVSTLDRSRSQLQHTSVRKLQARGRRPNQAASPTTAAANSEGSPEPESATPTSPSSTPKSASPPNTSAPDTPAVSTSQVVQSSAILATPQGVGALPLTPPSSSGPVSYVKLIPIQLIPVNNASGAGQKGSSGAPGSLTGATTTFISVPVSLKGAGDTATPVSGASSIVNYLVEAPPATLKPGERHRAKALPNLIPIGAGPTPTTLPLKEKNTPEARSPPAPLKGRPVLRDGRNGLNTENKATDHDGQEAEAQVNEGGKGDTWTPQDPPPPTHQIAGKKRYVPILPMIPLPDTPPHSSTPPVTPPTSQHLRQSRTVSTKRPWQGYDRGGYKRRRTPTYFTGSQREVLEVHFEYNNFPEPVEQLAIASQLGVDYPVVKTWFQNTRKNMRKQLKEEANYDQDGPFHCHKCGVAFITRSALTAHCDRHRDKTSFFCGECWMYFTHPAVFNTHLMSHAGKFGDKKKKPLSCEEEEEEEDEEEEGGGSQMEGDEEEDEEEEEEEEENERRIKRKKGKDGEKEEEEEEEEEEEGDWKNENSREITVESKKEERRRRRRRRKVDENKTDSQEEEEDEDEDEDVNIEQLDEEDEEDEEEEEEEEKEDDLEDYHSIMPVECILDEQSEEEIDIGTPSSTESPGHKCPSCDESFASLISLKEHTSLHCSQRRRRRRRSTSPPFVAACTTTTHLNTSGEPRREFCSSIRCFECRSLFPDRQSFMHHFTVTRCSLNRQRIEYTEEEQSILATHYRENNFPMPAEMSLLAKRLGVRYRQIMHWFQNRRSKERKQQRENKNPPVECVECKSTFVTEQNLKSHQAAVHSEAKESAVQEFPCTAPGCDASFTNEDLLVTHRLAHLPESEGNGMGSSRLTILGPKPQWKNFTVTVLEAHYSDNNFPEPMDIGYIARRLDVDPLHIHMWFKERRNQHIRKLEESGRVVVEGGLAVSSQRALSRVCNTCDAAFICQTDLDTHSEMHKSSWAQKCNMCSKEFSNVIALETHWIRHGVEFMGEAGEGTKQEATTTAATTTASTTTTTTTAAPPPSLPAPERMAKASFSGLQLKVLDGHYQQNHFPGAAEVWLVARRLGLRPRQVTHWFQNRRGRERRAHKVTTPASHPCLWCGAAFITPPALRRHRRHHRNTAARHACAQCSAVFLTAMLLETHSLLHQTSPHSRSTSPSQRPPDSSRDPLAVGQVRPGTLPAPSDTDESDGSEPELSIDLTATPAAEEGQGEAGMAGTHPAPSWHTPQPVMEEVDEEMVEMLRHAGIEVTDESLAGKESPASKDKAASKVDESDEVGESGEVRGQEFTLTEEEASASLEKDVICEQVFFDDHTDSEDDSEEEEPRLKIVSAYTISPSESDKARASEAQ